MTDLPRNADGVIITSAGFGQSYIVEVEYGDGATTLHGPFSTEAEAVSWMIAYPDFEDLDDLKILVLNNVRPTTEPP